MQLEKAQYRAKANTTGAFGLLWRFLVVFFAATVSLAPTATVLAQQSDQTTGQTSGAVKALAATTTTTQKETAPKQLNTVQPDTATDTAASAIRPFRVNVPQEALDDLRRRIIATKWPEREYVTDRTQGVQLATVQKLARSGFFDVKNVSIPVAVSVFPDEIYAAPRSWAERAYPKLIHYNKLDKGGHFAAWEQPQLFVSELRVSFKSLR